MTDDADLLRRYAELRDDSAFAELVDRHLGMVYHVALRTCGGDAHRAQDAAQSVFVDLARKARRLPARVALAGWLHTSARYAASRAVRSEARRQAREQIAFAMSEAPPDAQWERLRPEIDDALQSLGEKDREAILLRFFENRPFGQIGAALSVSEDAARVRVNRAIEKLRAVLSQRGLTSTTAAFSAVLSAHAAAAPPPSLAAAVTGAALAGAASAAAPGAAISLMSMNSLKIALAATAALAGAGGLLLQHRANTQLSTENASLRQQIQDLDIADNTERAQAKAREIDLQGLQAEVAALKTTDPTSVQERPEPKTQHPLAAGLKPAETFTNAGRSTPRAALETLHWAINGGNAALIAQDMVLPPDTQKAAADLFDQLPPDKKAEYGTPDQLVAALLASTNQIAGAQVLSEKDGAQAPGFDASLKDDPTYRTLHLQAQYTDGRVRERDVVVQQTPDGWRNVVLTSQIERLSELQKPMPANLKHDGGG